MNRDIDLAHQIMRDVEELQRQFRSAQTTTHASSGKAVEKEPGHDRRQDRASAAAIAEALRMKTAFGERAAQVFAAGRGIPIRVAERALAGRHDQRRLP